MRISAKADYAVRAAVELAASPGGMPVKGTQLADAQAIPLQFLEHILLDLKRAGLIRTKRGARGGYWLAEDPGAVSVADVIRAVEGPLANIQDLPPEETHYGGAAERLRDVWIAVRQNLRVVLESVSLADLAAKRLPDAVTSLLDEPEAWVVRETGSHDVVG
ncbi:MAG: Rrf2 family transcriptional regulator [Acidobacteria bacterium]|nr:MAG: Rrf2 family transcriptional regulator [Acidobacteriota bacterium]MCL4287394.1 Rrf2 family transcriptional regulator [Thermoleophilia bacterium]GIK78818.1 MAG: Rrf2 family transcriptional regulator [Actinomycetes bacterium]